MNARHLCTSLLTLSLSAATSAYAAQPVLVAVGSVSGFYEDFAMHTAAPLE